MAGNDCSSHEVSPNKSVVSPSQNSAESSPRESEQGMVASKKPRRERGTGGMWRIGEIWWIQFYSRGKKVRESSHSRDEKVALKLLRRRRNEVAAGDHQPEAERLTYADLRESYMADYVTNHRRSVRYVKDKDGNPRPTLATVERLDKFFAGIRVSQIDTTMMKKFAALLQSEGLSNGSINRSLSALRRMFHLAMEEQRLRFIPYFPMLDEAAPRKGFFERDEYQKLHAALPEYLRPVLAIGYYTGMRRAEITTLKWEQVDLLNRVIHLNAGETKNGEGRDVQIASELYAVLAAQHAKRVAGCPLVCFRATKGGRTMRIGDFRKIWYAHCVKLGLGEMKQATDPATGAPLWEPGQGAESERKPKLVYVGRIFHDLRRTGVRNLVRAGVPERIAMKITGHKTRSVFERYNIVSPRDLEEAGRKLDAYHSEKNGPSLVQTDSKTELAKSVVN